MYDTYSRLIYEFLQNNWGDISEMLVSVNALSTSVYMLVGLVRMILQALIFFGLLNFGFKFIKARWLTIC